MPTSGPPVAVITVVMVTPVMGMAPVTIVMPVPMAPIRGVTPIAIVMLVPMVAPVDRFNDALCAFQGLKISCGSSLDRWRPGEHEQADSERRKKPQHGDFSPF